MEPDIFLLIRILNIEFRYGIACENDIEIKYKLFLNNNIKISSSMCLLLAPKQWILNNT